MTTKEIERLIEKFYNGNTSLEEEKILKSYFLNDDIAPHLRSLKSHFAFLDKESTLSLNESLFQKRFEESIEDESFITFSRVKKLKWYLTSGLAAACIAMFFFISFPFAETKVDTQQVQAADLAVVQKWLLFTSSKLNKGVNEAENLKYLGKGIHEMNQLESLRESIKKISKN